MKHYKKKAKFYKHNPQKQLYFKNSDLQSKNNNPDYSKYNQCYVVM